MIERRSESDGEALAALGSTKRLAVDIDRLKALPQAKYTPLVEYLTGIQSLRGESGRSQSLMFVRSSDVAKIASLAEADTDAVLEGFEEMGVVLSVN